MRFSLIAFLTILSTSIANKYDLDVSPLLIVSIATIVSLDLLEYPRAARVSCIGMMAYFWGSQLPPIIQMNGIIATLIYYTLRTLQALCFPKSESKKEIDYINTYGNSWWLLWLRVYSWSTMLAAVHAIEIQFIAYFLLYVIDSPLLAQVCLSIVVMVHTLAFEQVTWYYFNLLSAQPVKLFNLHKKNLPWLVMACLVILNIPLLKIHGMISEASLYLLARGLSAFQMADLLFIVMIIAMWKSDPSYGPITNTLDFFRKRGYLAPAYHDGLDELVNRDSLDKIVDKTMKSVERKLDKIDPIGAPRRNTFFQRMSTSEVEVGHLESESEISTTRLSQSSTTMSIPDDADECCVKSPVKLNSQKAL